MTTNNTLIISALYFFIVGLHIAATWSQSAASVVPDEISYLSQARYFAGKDDFPDTKTFLAQESALSNSDTIPSTQNWRYYHFGYSLLVSPIYWLADTPATAYKGVMILNSFMLSTLFLIIFFWARMISEVSFYTATAIAFIVSLYPPYIYQAQIGWAENALIPGFALCCLLFTHHLKTNHIPSVILFALTAGFQFTIHPRGLAVSIAAIICLVSLLLIGKDKWRITTIGVSTILGIIITTKAMSNKLAAMMSTSSQGEQILQQLSFIFELDLTTAIVGNLLYLTLATLGLFLLGLTKAIKPIIDNSINNLKSTVSDIHTGSLLYLLIASGLLFCVSLVFLGRSEEWHDTSRTLDHLLYGRYNEPFLSLYITLGLLWINQLHKKGIHQYSKYLIIAFWILAAVDIAFFLVFLDYQYLRSIHSFGIFPWYILTTITIDWLGNAPIFFLPLIWTWLILRLFLESKEKGLVAMGVYFFLLDISLLIYSNQDLQIMG
jgi:hypothetical protein